MKLYLAGPILNIENPESGFARDQGMLIMSGFEVLVPMDIPACPDGRCWSLGTRLTPWNRSRDNEHTYECYIRYDLIEMLKCDGVAYRNGWETSFGTRNELYQAGLVGMPVHSVDWWVENPGGMAAWS